VQYEDTRSLHNLDNTLLLLALTPTVSRKMK